MTSIAMKLKLKNNAVLIKEIKEVAVTKSGLLLPTQKYNRKAEVIATASSDVNVGDVILKTIGHGTIFNIDGQEYEILHEDHILAKII